VSAVYLKTYLELAGAADFLPKDPREMQILLGAFCLEKAIYELRYELNNRPEWVNIPLLGILQLLEATR
jgi:maltose alpha-D-glucosyltransferase/alpha-amylase